MTKPGGSDAKYWSTVSFRIGHKTLQLVERYAEEYNLSRANALLRLVEVGLLSVGEKKLERTTTLPEGTDTWANYSLRNVL